jgi:energy-coupling factor transporter ATP-binding protein EcfA2
MSAGNLLEVRHLSKAFGSNSVLRDIGFTVSKGDVICVIGASGSGKSTLLRCINLLETPSAGKYCSTERYHPGPFQYRRVSGEGGHGVSELQPVCEYERREQLLDRLAQGLKKRQKDGRAGRLLPIWTRSACRRTLTPSPASSRAGKSSAWPSPGRGDGTGNLLFDEPTSRLIPRWWARFGRHAPAGQGGAYHDHRHP